MRRILMGGCLGAALCGYSGFYELSVPSPTGPAYQRLPQTPYDQHPNQHFLTKVPKTIGIIGGGSAGLVTAKVLSQQGFQVEVLEKNSRTGGVWAENYQDAGLQGPVPHYNMPDHVFPADSEMFPKLEKVRDFLDEYAEKFGLRPLISLNSEVTKVVQNSAGDWTVELKGGATKKYDFLVLSSGLYTKPNIPDFPGLTTFAGKVLHSFDFRNAKETCNGKKVVVVGGHRSALEIMHLASENGGKVTSVMRNRAWTLPLDYTLFGYPSLSLITSRLAEFLNPLPGRTQRLVSTLATPFSSLYWWYLSKDMSKTLPESLKPTTSLRLQWNRHMIARHSPVVAKVASGAIEVVTGEVDKIVPEGIVVQGKTIPADVIVFATGFQANTFGFSSPNDCLWLYRGVLLPETRNFAAIGYGSFVFSQLKNSLQAVWLAEVLRGTVRLPSSAAMASEVENRKKDIITVHGQEAKSAAYAWSETMYYDMLLTDMGLQARRKRTHVSNWLDMPEPTEYRAVVTHRV